MKQTPKIALIGYGRMGQEIHAMITDRGWPEPCIVDPQKERVYESIDDLIGRGVHVCIEFTAPNQAAKNIIACVRAGLPVVSGTTGWEGDRDKVEEAVDEYKGSCIHASNFSIGVYLFHRIAVKAAAMMADFTQYDFALHEIHHTAKKDAPSGTALALAQDLLVAYPGKRKISTTLPDGPVDPSCLYITSTRVGSVIGEHQLIADSDADQIEIIHRAKGRQGFVEGALLAAQWICDKKGLFTLEDLIHDITKA